MDELLFTLTFAAAAAAGGGLGEETGMPWCLKIYLI